MKHQYLHKTNSMSCLMQKSALIPAKKNLKQFWRDNIAIRWQLSCSSGNKSKYEEVFTNPTCDSENEKMEIDVEHPTLTKKMVRPIVWCTVQNLWQWQFISISYLSKLHNFLWVEFCHLFLLFKEPNCKKQQVVKHKLEIVLDVQFCHLKFLSCYY